MARTVEDCAPRLVRADGEPVPKASLEGKRIGKLTRHPSLGEVEAGRTTRAPTRCPASPSSCRRRGADVWPVFYADAAESHRGLYPERAAEYGPVIAPKLDARVRDDGRLRAALAAMVAGGSAGRRGPAGRRDRLARPRHRRAAGAGTPEAEFRIPFSAYARPYNFLGWPAIAIGET